MNFITLHRVCGRNIVEPITFNVATINTIVKAQDNREYNTMIISGNSKYMIQENYETIIDILENRMEGSNVYSTAVLSKMDIIPKNETVSVADDKLKIIDELVKTFGLANVSKEVIVNNGLEDAYYYYMAKNFGQNGKSRPEFLTKHINMPVEEENK